MDVLVQALKDAFGPLGFRDAGIDCTDESGLWLILRRQTWNTNRAIALIRLHSLPEQFRDYLRDRKREIAKLAGSFPFFYVLGLQAVIICETPVDERMDLSAYTDKFDDQRSILQSIYVIDETRGDFMHARTWGQAITGKYQDEIVNCLRRLYRER